MGKSKEDISLMFKGAEDWTPGNNEGGMYYLYGQCANANLEKALGTLQANLVQIISKAEAYHAKILNKENYFKMVFGFNHETRMRDFHEAIFDAWWDTNYANQYKLKLFFYNDIYTSFDMGCEYYIQYPKNEMEEEHEAFNFQVGDYDNVHEVHLSRLAAIEKYIEFRLLEANGSKEVIKKAKEEWEKAVKVAEEAKKEELSHDYNEAERTEWLEKIKKSYNALKKVPKELVTEEFCLAAVQLQSRFMGSALQYVPKELKTKEVCIAAVKHRGLALAYVPPKLKTAEICQLAVQQNADAVSLVPDSLMTKDICLMAVQKKGLSLGGLPDELKTEDICLAAVQNNGFALQYVPEALKTMEICLAAVQADKYGLALNYVPDALKAKVQGEEKDKR